MKRIKGELNVMVDVDDTLVMHDVAPLYIDTIEFIDPYDHKKIQLRPHHRHIKLVKDFKARGCRVFVWSAAGEPWAHEVVTKLGLTDYVYATITKPVKFLDDLPAQEVLVNRIYLKE